MSVSTPPAVAAGSGIFKLCGFYGRISSVMQRPASLADQLHSCREFTEGRGWLLLDDHCYTDSAKSGTSTVDRDGFKALIAAAERKLFDAIVCDDTSRPARDEGDMKNFIKLMRHAGVTVHFISQNLHSSDENFDMMLTMYALFDSQFVTRLKKKVFSGQKGRVLAGFNVGSAGYAYRSIRIVDIETPGAVKQAATLGSKLVRVEEEAEIVRRIFNLFLENHSHMGIAKILNEEGVPSPMNSRARRPEARWDASTIKTILRNCKYRGLNVWNVSFHKEHPITGKVTKVLKAPSEHVEYKDENLRIVSDDVWFAAAARLQSRHDLQVRRVDGGYNRAANMPYLYSGLLHCCKCGSRLVIGGKQGNGRYRCPRNRLRQGCPNAMSIPEKIIAAQLTAVIANELFRPDYLDQLVSCVFTELQAAHQRQVRLASNEELPRLVADYQRCKENIEHLLDFIEANPSDSVRLRLAKREFEASQLEQKIALHRGRKKLEVTRESLEGLVRENVANLIEVLKGDVHLARAVLAQHLNKLVVYPDSFTEATSIAVIGEIGLFQGERALKSGVLVGGQGTPTSHQHTYSPDLTGGEFDPFYRFCTVLPLSNEEPCRLLEPLCNLLAERPELAETALSAGEWASLLCEAVGDMWDPGQPLGYGTVGRCFRLHRSLLTERLNMVVTQNPQAPLGRLYQMSLVGGQKFDNCPARAA